MEKRVCYRCLLKEMAEKDYSEKIGKYIGAISPEERTKDEQYETRLTICKACDFLIDGTCNACGCYVELRAASNKAACPKKKW